MSVNTERFPALCLNADYRPLSTHPLKTMDWMRSVKAVFGNRYYVIEEYDTVLRCPGSHRRKAFEMRIPSVVALKHYQPQHRAAPFTRMNVYMRSGGQCEYCSRRISLSELTFDHVIPKSTGGSTCFKNVVAACGECNAKKANKSLKECGFKLKNRIYVPTRAQMTDMGLEWMRGNPLVRKRLPATWLPYLGLDAPLEEDIARVSDGESSEAVFPKDMTSEEYWSVELEG